VENYIKYYVKWSLLTILVRREFFLSWVILLKQSANWIPLN